MAVMTDTQSVRRPDLGHPDRTRAPERRNVYSHVRNIYAQLVPLFDDARPGAMAPAGAFLHGGVPWGRFFHKNSVDEVTVCFGSRGGLLDLGAVNVGGRVHGVDSFLQDPDDPASFLVLVITQRQADSGEQDESIAFRCTECNHKIFELEYSLKGPTDPDHRPETWPGQGDDPFEFFATQWGSWAAACEFNADENLRTCEKCGHVNAPFPVGSWGWESYVERHAAVAKSYRDLINRSLPERDG
jgi:hypothetical protein